MMFKINGSLLFFKYMYQSLIFWLLMGFVSSTTTVSQTDQDADDDEKESIPKSMIIGLSIGFGSVCVVLICCCFAFKCIGCKDEGRKTLSSSNRKIAWDD